MTSHLGRRLLGAVAASLALLAAAPAAQAGETPYVGEIMVTIDDICPTGWLPADGRAMSISQNSALFSLLGSSFGGDGRTTFNLPDLRGRTVVGTGFSSSQEHPLNRSLSVGEKGGAESTTLSVPQIPLRTSSDVKSASGAGTIAATFPIAPAPIATMPPWIALTACIATSGIFPSIN